VEVRDRVEKLRRATGRPNRCDRRAQPVGDQTVVVHRNLDHVRLVGVERSEGADVGRRLGDDDVTRVDEDAGDEVERLLRSNGDDDLVGVRGYPLQAHHRADLLPQHGMALPGAVLQRGDAVLTN
jgi:hypothetical protein